MPDFQIVLYPLIEFIEIDVRKELGREIADGNTGAARRCYEAPDDPSQQLHRPFVLDLLAEDMQQNGVINGCEELVNVTFEGKALPPVIVADLPQHTFERDHGLVRPLIFPAGEGVGNERRLEDGVEHGKDGMMHNAVAHRCLVDAALLGIADGECAVGSVLVRLSAQLPMQQE